MHISFPAVDLLLHAVADFERAALVVGAIAAGDEFFVFALVGEPGFEVVFFGRSVVERAADDGDDAVGEL